MPKPRFPDRAIVRFPPGMLARVEAVLKPGEDRGAFILAATAAALRRLEREEARAREGVDRASPPSPG